MARKRFVTVQLGMDHRPQLTPRTWLETAVNYLSGVLMLFVGGVAFTLALIALGD